MAVLRLAVNAAKANTAKIGHFFFPSGQVAVGKVGQAIVPASPRQNLHKFNRGTKVSCQFLRTDLHIKPRAQVRFLGRDADRAIVGIAHARGYAAHGLHGRI